MTGKTTGIPVAAGMIHTKVFMGMITGSTGSICDPETAGVHRLGFTVYQISEAL